MLKGLMLAVLLVLLSPSVNYAESVTAACDPWPPFIIEGETRKGIAFDIVAAAYQTQGYSVSLHMVPWARAIHEVKKGSFDILPTTWMSEERKEFLAYSKPFATNRIVVVKRKGDPFEYSGLESLRGKIIGTILGYSYDEEFTDARYLKKQSTYSFLTNVKKLLRDRIELTVEDELAARYILSTQAPELLEQVEFCKVPLSTRKLYLTSGLANPNHARLVETFNKGLTEIKANGTYEDIFAKYGFKVTPSP